MIVKSLIKMNLRLVESVVSGATSAVLRTACLGVCAVGVAVFVKNKQRLAKQAEPDDNWIPDDFTMTEMSCAEPVPAAPVKVSVKEDTPDVCYYTSKGNVWHYARSCSYLKSAEDLQRGSLEEAEAVGKTRPCTRCATKFVKD